MRRVVVTGLGAVTPVGNDVPAFWENLWPVKTELALWIGLILGNTKRK